MKSNGVMQSHGKLQQFIAATIVNILSISYGITIGWPSPVIPQLRSSHTPVGDTPMSPDQVSWLTSLPLISGLIGLPFCNILCERVGRKNFALVTTLPLIASWLIIIFAENFTHLLTSRFVVGISGAMIIFIVPLYVSEIASEDIRGILGTLLVFSLNAGILFGYIAGAFLSYRIFAIVSLIIPLVAFIATLAFLPETPIYLLRRDRQNQAHKSLMFLRGNNQVLVEEELIKLRPLSKSSEDSCKLNKFSDLLKDKATRMGLLISFGLCAAQQFSGILAMLNYAETIFKLAGSSLSAEIASIIIGTLQLISTCLSTMLVERAGRRSLTLISCIGMTIGHSLVGLFFYLQQNHYNVSSISWLPLVALSLYIITYCLGIGAVPVVIISEVFRLDISSFASNVCFVFLFVVGFVSVKLFDIAMRVLGTDGCFFMLASCCAASFVFSYCFLFETKGRKRKDIINELGGIDREKIDDVDERAEIKTLINADTV